MDTLPTRDPELEERSPKLRDGGYSIESPKDKNYNCVAYAAGNPTRWWQWMPYPTRGYYWPISWDNTIDSWKEVFRLHGYELCDTSDFEKGFEKVAIYIDDDDAPSHVAKQDVASSRWISKLGKSYDIKHDSVELLAGNDEDEYGSVRVFMKRPTSIHEQKDE